MNIIMVRVNLQEAAESPKVVKDGRLVEQNYKDPSMEYLPWHAVFNSVELPEGATIIGVSEMAEGVADLWYTISEKG